MDYRLTKRVDRRNRQVSSTDLCVRENSQPCETTVRRAEKCRDCRVCKYARRKQGGIVYWFMRVENRICPFARAYRKVYGRMPTDPDPAG